MTMARLTEATDVDLDPAAGMTVFEGSKKKPADQRSPRHIDPVAACSDHRPVGCNDGVGCGQ